MMDTMERFFSWTVNTRHLLFKGLDITGTSSIAEACIVLFLATFLLEGTKCLMLYWNTRLSQHPLTYGQTDSSYQDNAPLFASLMIPSSIDYIKQRRVQYHCLGFLTHIFNLILGYFIMLAVMRYNFWLLLAVLAGKIMSQVNMIFITVYPLFWTELFEAITYCLNYQICVLIMITCVFSSLVGYFIFGAIGVSVQAKYSNLIKIHEVPDIGHINDSHSRTRSTQNL